MQIDLYNVRTVMVPEGAAETARDLLAHYVDGRDEPGEESAGVVKRWSWWNRIRLVLELAMFGWCVPPANQRRRS